MPVYAPFECIIKELDGKYKCICKENVALFFWKFCWD